MEAYSKDLRKRVVQAWDAGEGTQPQLAERFKVSVPWVKKVLRQRRHEGTIAPRPKSNAGRKLAIQGEHLERLEQLTEQQPDATLAEYLRELELPCSVMAVSRALARLKITRKKKSPAPQSKTARM